MTPTLIVTVDTEEEGLWSGQFSARDNPVENIKGVPAFQAICDTFAIKPTYLVDTPILDDTSATSVLDRIIAQNGCEIGCHIHPWNTPPVEHNIDSVRSYLCNLPLDLQREKLTTVTEHIESRFGLSPTSFRAGRYGLDSDGASILSELNYIVDSSVCPFMDYSGDGGPDFRGAPWKPYYVGDNLCQPSSVTTNLLEVPVSFGFNWSNFEQAYALYEFLAYPPLNRLRLRGIFDRLEILQRIKFSPEKSTSRQLNALADAYRRNDAPCIVMMFHSSSLQPGFTPYVTDSSELKRFLKTIEETFRHCIHNSGMQTKTLSEFAQWYSENGACSANVK